MPDLPKQDQLWIFLSSLLWILNIGFRVSRQLNEKDVGADSRLEASPPAVFETPTLVCISVLSNVVPACGEPFLIGRTSPQTQQQWNCNGGYRYT